MDKKTKIALAVIKEVKDKFREMQAFIDKAHSKKCHKEIISVEEVFLTLIIIFSCVMMLCFYMGFYEIHYFLLFLISSRSF